MNIRAVNRGLVYVYFYRPGNGERQGGSWEMETLGAFCGRHRVAMAITGNGKDSFTTSATGRDPCLWETYQGTECRPRPKPAPTQKEREEALIKHSVGTVLSRKFGSAKGSKQLHWGVVFDYKTPY